MNSEAIFFIALIGAMLIDRFLLKRDSLKIKSTRRVDDEKSIRFALHFFSQQKISNGRLTYGLRSKKKPAAVLNYNRHIISSQNGAISEYLTFSKSSLEREAGGAISGKWILNVTIESSWKSCWNPLYKLFPTSHTHTMEFDLD